MIKLVSTTWRSALALLLALSILPTAANDNMGPTRTNHMSDGRWEDSFDDATGLDDLNQTLVADGALRLNGEVHQLWEISSQISFQAGELDQVDAEAVPGALQLAPATLSLNPNQLMSVSDVSSYDLLYYDPPALAGDGDQVLHLAWVRSLAQDVYYRCSTDAGESWTAIESLTDDGAAISQRAPELAVDSAGVVYAVWQDEQLDANGDIYIASRPGCGGSWSAPTPVAVAATVGPSQDDPALAIDGADSVYLAWEEEDDIYFSRSDDGGQSWSTAQKLNDDSSFDASSPDIVVDPTGQNALVVWAYGPSGARDIYFSSSDDGGQTWSANMTIAPDPAKSQIDPAVVRAISGELYVAWTGGGAYTSRSLDGGQTWSAAVRVDDEPFGMFWFGTSLAIDNQGTIYLAWHDKRHAVPPGNPLTDYYYDIFMAYSQESGQSWSANIQLNDDPVLPGIGDERIDHMHPAVTVNQAGQFFAAWWDERGTCVEDGGTVTCTYPPTREVYFVSTSGDAFAINGTFTSAVHDANGQATWDAITWTATTPTSTTLTLHTRSGDTPVPDAGWSGWSAAYSAPGQPIASPRARYAQARTVLSTTNPLTTPILYDVTLYYRPFIWEQTTQADFEASIVLQNVDVTTVPSSVRLLPDVVFIPEQQVNDQSGGVEQIDDQPAMAVVGNSVYLAWRDTRNDSEGDIFFTHSTDGGQTWGMNIQINDDPPGAVQSAPYLAAQGNDVYLVWHDEREGGEGNVYFARSTDGGQSWSPNQRVNDNVISVMGDPAIVTGAGTRLHVTWATSKTLIYANRSPDAGQNWEGNVAVGGADLGTSFLSYPAPGTITNESGDVYAIWQDTRNSFHDGQNRRDLEIFADRSTDNGASWGTDVQVNDDGGLANQFRPSLAFDDGTLYAVWADFRNGNVLTGTDIYFSRSLDGGQNWSANLQVNSNELTYADPAPVVAVDSDGTIYASWQSDHFDSADDVFFSRSLDDGNTWQAERRINTDGTGILQGAPALVATTPGRVYLAWHDERVGSQDLYFTTSLSGTTYTSGTLVSSVLNTEGAAQWGDIAWTATTPPSTSLTLYTRSGDTTDPDDDSWSGWSTGYITSPAPITSPLAQYLQYRVDLATTNPYTTPVLHDVSVEYGRYPLQGSAISFPVSPPIDFREWQTLTFSTTEPSGTTLEVHVLDSDGQVLLESAESGVSLADYPPEQYPSLRLRADLGTSDPTVTPALNEWALNWYPPPPEDHVQVVNESGEPAGGADIYYNGSFLGTADHLGILALLEPPQAGDTLSALHPLTETPTIRDVHNGWAHRTYITNIAVDAQGIPQAFVVSQEGAQVLTVRPENTLILFNLIVSIEWDASDDYMAEIARAARHASDYLYDLTDGQMAFGQVIIYDEGENWANADIQISTKNIVRPHAYIGGITSDDTSHVIRVGRGWDGASGNQGAWDEPDGYRTLGHEFGHYALYLYDEYIAYLFDQSGNLIGEAPTSCTGPENQDPATEAVNASVMDYQYTSTELSAQGVPGLWSPLCEETAQWQLNGESPWETLARAYTDTVSPPRWQLTTPADRGSVLAGPTGVPTGVLSLPTVIISNTGSSGPPRQLTLYDPQEQPYPGAIVALYKLDGRVIGQGFTDGDGQLTIYGTAEGDTLRAASMDGGLAGKVTVETGTNLTLTLAPVGGLKAQATGDGGIPHMRVIADPGPDPSQTDLYVFLHDFGPGADPSVIVTAPGSEVGYAPVLSYSLDSDRYEGQISFAATERGMGRIRAVGEVGGGLVRLQSTYRLQRVENDRSQDVYSDDGNLSLHLDEGSLPGNEAYLVVMPPGMLSGPLQAGLTLVGDPYDVTAGVVMEMEKPGILKLRYDGALINSSVPPAGLGIYRWNPNGDAWQAVWGELDEEQGTVVAPVTVLGTYALLAPSGSSNIVFLPLALKETP